MRIGTKLERDFRERPDVRAAFGDADPLAVLRDLGITFVEWPLPVEFEEGQVWSLVEECRSNGLGAHLHPYLEGAADTANFEQVPGNECGTLIARYLAFADRVSALQGRACVVNLHPPCSLFARAAIPAGHTRRILVLRSLYFHRWVVELIEQRGWTVILTSELQYAAEPDETFVRLGDHYRELLFCMSGVPGAAACWDMGHSTINHTRFGGERYPLVPRDDFPTRVGHVHLHDVHGREDHHPLSGGATPYREHLARLRRAGFDGDVNLEIPVRRVLEHGPYREVMAENVRRVREAWDLA